MSVDLRSLAVLKEKVASLRSKSERAAGALEAAIGSLSSEYDCEDIGEAEELLDELSEQSAKLESDYKKLLGKFQKKWAKQLELV
jgi:hypothetical protein